MCMRSVAIDKDQMHSLAVIIYKYFTNKKQVFQKAV